MELSAGLRISQPLVRKSARGLVISDRKPISTAPRDGSKVTVYWKDRDDQENESVAQYRSLDRLKAAGGDWDETDAGWWTFIDGSTQKRIEPTEWSPKPDEESD